MDHADANPPSHAAAEHLDAVAAMSRRVLEEIDDVGTWMFLHLSRRRLPYWSPELRELALSGLTVEPFAHTPVSDTWRWAEPASHADIAVPERPLARTTGGLRRIVTTDRAPLQAVLEASMRDTEVREAELSTPTDEGVRAVVLVARGCRPCPRAAIDVVVGFAVAGPAQAA